MNEVAEGIAAFIRSTDEHLPSHPTTRDVLAALRAHLDATVPGWRARVFESRGVRDALVVDVHLRSGRVVRGVLLQQTSGVRVKGDRQ